MLGTGFRAPLLQALKSWQRKCCLDFLSARNIWFYSQFLRTESLFLQTRGYTGIKVHASHATGTHHYTHTPVPSQYFQRGTPGSSEQCLRVHPPQSLLMIEFQMLNVTAITTYCNWHFNPFSKLFPPWTLTASETMVFRLQDLAWVLYVMGKFKAYFHLATLQFWEVPRRNGEIFLE